MSSRSPGRPDPNPEWPRPFARNTDDVRSRHSCTRIGQPLGKNTYRFGPRDGTTLAALTNAGVKEGEDVMRKRLILPAVAALSLFMGGQALAAPVVVACGPGQRAVVRDTFVRGHDVTRVECVRGAVYRPGYRTRYVTRYRVRRPHRSWGKSALIIGGSAATGAGIGGIVDGRKGALIGGALAGGAGSLYEGAHRR